jgi:hypothetical protein
MGNYRSAMITKSLPKVGRKVMPCDYGCAFMALRGFFGDTFTKSGKKYVVRTGVVRICLDCEELEIEDGATIALLEEEKLPDGAPV